MPDENDEPPGGDQPLSDPNPAPAFSTAQVLAVAATEAAEERRRAYEVSRPRILSSMFDGLPAAHVPRSGGTIAARPERSRRLRRKNG
jgi:hypothetical protein